MKFLSSTLTFLLKFIFFTVFVLGICVLSILHTYLDKEYYENYFAEQFIEMQSEHIANIITIKSESLPFRLSEEQVESALKVVFTKEHIQETFNVLFDAVEKYNGKTLTIDLKSLQEREHALVEALVDSGIDSLEECKKTDIASHILCIPEETSKASIKKQAKIFLTKNIQTGIPPFIEIETEETAADNVFSGLQFILTHKSTVTSALLALIFLPLFGIFMLNIHPYYKGMGKVASSLISVGITTSLIKTLSTLAIKFVNLSFTTESAFTEANMTIEPEKAQRIFDFVFGGMLHFITVIGLCTLGIGILLYAISKLIQRRHEYSY